MYRREMASNGVIFKVFLRGDGIQEARKFIIDDASVITSYVFIKGKLAMIFPKLNNAAYKITWKDTEGDEITIDSDEDLMMAFTEMTDIVKTLYITLPTNQSTPQFPGSNVYCDGCNKPITGYRYKCLQCPDFDLCIECEHAGQHSEHYMLRSSNGELPFGATCKRIGEIINKTVRKAHSMAYKEACRNAKAGKKFDRKFDHCNKYDRSCRYDNQAGPSECPMSFAVPFYDIVNTAAQACAELATPAPQETKEAQKDQSQQEPQSSQQAQATQPPPHFMEVMIKALNNIFPEAKASCNAEQPTKAHNTTPVGEQTPLTTPAPEQSPIPMEQDYEHMRSQERNPSWTILDNDISIHTQQEAIPSAPSSPPLDPKLMDGLKQLKDMGFGDHPDLIALLRRYDGNVGNVIRHMFDNI